MILYNQSVEELNATALDFLSHTAITNTKPGSRARAILEIENKILGSYYQALDFNVTMAFVSRAAGDFLDAIGELLNCSRRTGEDDENYRYRITNQVYVVEGCNKTAIRLAALSVENVVDVVLTPWVFGTGSFTVHVITDTLENLSAALVAVQAKLDELEAFGVKGVAVSPKTVPLYLNILLTFLQSTTEAVKKSISTDIKRQVTSYINNLNMGDKMILSDINYICKQYGKGAVQDVTFTRIEVNQKPVLIQNYVPYWDEKLYVDATRDITIV